MVNKIIKEIFSLSNEKDKASVMRFFKAGKGQYGEDDKFLGIKVPRLRGLAKKRYKELSFNDLEELLQNEYHEVREFALFCLVLMYKENPMSTYELYLRNIKYVNNWDLVDSSAPHILGKHLYDNNLSREIIDELAESNDLWKQRIAIIATQYFIKNGDFAYTLTLAKMYLTHEEDLIRKATGWMLREVGEKDYSLLLDFLKENVLLMPNVMFSYAIEKLELKDKELLKEIRKNN